MKAGIALDDWKLPIFKRHLAQSGYTHSEPVGLSAGTLLITVETPNPEALREVVLAANTEAANCGVLQ